MNKEIKEINRETIMFLALIIIVILRMLFVFNNERQNSLLERVGEEVLIKGKIITEPEIKKITQTFTIEFDKETNIKITTEPYEKYFIGDIVSVSGRLLLPRNFKSGNGRVFDYINYLKKDGIIYEFKKAKVSLIDDFHNLSYINKNLSILKQTFVDNLNKVLGEPQGALASGLVVGEKATLGKDIIENFRRAGLIHIVVLSGYNITIIAITIRRLLSFLPRNISIILGIVGIILFGILVGGGATVVRSCIMAVIALVGEFMRKDYKVLRALLIAGLFMLILNPLILFYDPSFQLSFLATFGLIVLCGPIEKLISFITPEYGVRGVVASTLATQIFVSPYILYIMGQLSIIGIFVNIIVLPFIPITMLLVALSGISGFASLFISKIFAWGAYIFLSYELFVVEKSAEIPFASITVPPFSGYIVLIVYAIYFIAFFKFPSIFTQFKFEKKSST